MKALVNPTEAMLLGLCAALLAALATALSALLVPLHPQTLHLRVPAAPTMQAAPFVAPPLANFSVINERLVFNPLRQPIEVALPKDKGSTAPPPPPTLALVGVIIDGAQRLALIKLPGAPFAAAFAIGTEIAGWQIKEIDADAVVLASGTTDDKVMMNGQANAAVPVGGTRP